MSDHRWPGDLEKTRETRNPAKKGQDCIFAQRLDLGRFSFGEPESFNRRSAAAESSPAARNMRFACEPPRLTPLKCHHLGRLHAEWKRRQATLNQPERMSHANRAPAKSAKYAVETGLRKRPESVSGVACGSKARSMPNSAIRMQQRLVQRRQIAGSIRPCRGLECGQRLLERFDLLPATV